MKNGLESFSERDPHGLPHQDTTAVLRRHCLVLSANGAHREIFSQAVQQGGWEVLMCAEVDEAMAIIRRTRFQMAWVDVTSTSHASNTVADSRITEVCETLAGLPNVLLAICGHEHQPQEEIWARQLGAWLYLPGVSVDDESDLAELCGHARQIAAGSSAAWPEG